jgi:hypothetical protein
MVHRNGFPSKESQYIKVDHSMIEELISEVQTLINHIVSTKRIEIEKWFSVMAIQNIES